MFIYELFQLPLIITYVKTLKTRNMSTHTIHKNVVFIFKYKNV